MIWFNELLCYDLIKYYDENPDRHIDGEIWGTGDKIGMSITDKDIMDSMSKKEFYLSSFGQDNDNELFIIDYNGTIYRLINI